MPLRLITIAIIVVLTVSAILLFLKPHDIAVAPVVKIKIADDTVLDVVSDTISDKSYVDNSSDSSENIFPGVSDVVLTPFPSIDDLGITDLEPLNVSDKGIDSGERASSTISNLSRDVLKSDKNHQAVELVEVKDEPDNRKDSDKKDIEADSEDDSNSSEVSAGFETRSYSLNKDIVNDSGASNVWKIMGAKSKSAILYNNITKETRSIEIGNYIEGVGRIKAISKESGKWLIIGSISTISQ